MMTPLIISVVGIFWIVLSMGGVMIMLEMRGNPKDRPWNSRLVAAHRGMGYVFALILAVMTIVMVKKVSNYQETMTPRVVAHIILGIGIIPLVTLKILTVRRLKRLSSDLVPLGKSIFMVSFVMILITAGYYFLHSSDIRYTSIDPSDTGFLDERFGMMVVDRKCNKCHSLERVFRSVKSEEGWTKTINRMAALATPEISPFDIKQAINFLLKNQETRQLADKKTLSGEIGKNLVNRKCTVCHDLERVYAAEMDEKQWIKTVQWMDEIMAEPGFLSDEEKMAIAVYLTQRVQSK